MYKNKLRRWGLRKNYTAAEKAFIVRQMEHYRNHHQIWPELELLGQPVKLDRIHRFVREGRKDPKPTLPTLPCDQFCENKTSVSSDLTAPFHAAIINECARMNLHETKRIAYTDSMERAMSLILFELRKYLTCAPASNSSDSCSSTDNKTIHARRIHDFGFSLLDGLRCLVAGKLSQAGKYFNTGCGMVREMIKMQPRTIFDILFATFLNPAWTSYDAMRGHILGFMYNMSTLILGSSHSLSVILHTVLRNAIDPSFLPLFFKRMIDNLEEVHKQPNTTILQLKRNLINYIRISGDYETAEGMIRQELHSSWKLASNVESARHIEMVRLLLARTRLDQCYHLEAQALYGEILRNDPRSQLDSSVWQESSIYAASHLGVLDMLNGRISDGETRLRGCLDAAVPRFGAHELDTVANCQWLENATQPQPQSDGVQIGRVFTDPFQWSGIDWNT
ncbi:hypothetical protein LTR84_012237 [Exophiala bonariae]|uniref:Clr5 domain-containing protein n=1 Tax=Exophiala bonariae TaxID=1690606 RepID=A0AAV9NI71_9EURO|nr:hypothetical protein LTR84_012237 [Exophiala bonariae]